MSGGKSSNIFGKSLMDLPRVGSHVQVDSGALRESVESINDRLSEGDANSSERLFHSNYKSQNIVLGDL